MLKRIDAATLERIKRAAAEGRITVAPQEQVSILEPWIGDVLEALGHPDALVTDESCVSDFGLTPEEISTISRKLGVEFKGYIVDVAMKLRDATINSAD
jgi:hypothetical protein